MVTKANAFDTIITSTGKIVSKTQYDLEKNLEIISWSRATSWNRNWRCWDKKPDTNGLVTTAALDKKATETENKIPSIPGLVATAALQKDTEMGFWYNN